MALDNALPQMQCGRCGYAACRPFAEALARGQADLTQCTPGGSEVARDLAALLGQTLPKGHATEPPLPLQVAVIMEPQCIGCTKCIQACPVDAIVGAAQCMHTVITEQCTGCALCVPACPVDCVELIPAPFVWDRHRGAVALGRYRARRARLGTAQDHASEMNVSETDRLRTEIAAAVERTRARRAAVTES